MSRFTDEMYETAARSPHALVTGEPDAPRRQTWGQIHEQARRMAGALAAAGIGHGDAVGILAGNPVDIAPACQAVWMRGASVTMLHQPTPRTDLALWARDTEVVIGMIGARTVVLGAPFEIAAPLLAERGIPVVTIAEMDAGTPVDPLPTD
ncbi:AMP-binding protein, partial [Rhodococcus sp. YH1]